MTQTNLINRFAIHQALHWAITGLIIPVLILLFQSRGLSLTDIGLVMAVWIGTTALLEIPLGSVADTYGRRATYLLSLIINVLGAAVLLVSSGFGLILTSAMLLGTARAVYSGTLDAWFYDRFQLIDGPKTYHSALSRVNVMVTLGLAIGALVGGWLPTLASEYPARFTSVYDLNVVATLVMNIVLFMLTWGLIPKDVTRPQKDVIEPSPFSQLKPALHAVMNHRVLLRLMQSIVVFGMVLSGVENLWQPYLSDIVQQSEQSTEIFGVITAGYFFMAGLSSWMSVSVLRWCEGSHRIVLLVSRSAAGIMLLILAFSSQLMSFCLAYLLFFFLFTLGENSQSVLINDSTLSRYRSTMLSISSVAVTVGGMTASIGLGYLADTFSIGVSWSVSAIVLTLSSLLFVSMPSHSEVDFKSAN
ncbi:MFS transporter [Vibrio ouci]|uniref:MFS transporter n=1 Tax=Vibrio ouci TaxID=2499078 RepID=A0A4Y8WGY0_9VIBR|nr:MFS transporter [Vibrio ouci]TFH92182.1 MFS transporter [Vibrio ouci]